MDELVRGYHSAPINVFGFDQLLVPASSDQDIVKGLQLSDHISDNHQFSSLPSSPNSSNLVSSSWSSSDEGDVTDAVLKCISQMLMEDDDFESGLSVLEDTVALQAAEKSLYDVLGQKYPPSPNRNPRMIYENVECPDEDFGRPSSSYSSNNFAISNNVIDFTLIGNRDRISSSLVRSSRVNLNFGYNSKALDCSGSFCDAVNGTVDSLVSSFQVLDPSTETRAISSQIKKGVGNFKMIIPGEDYENGNLEWKEKTPKALSKAEKLRWEHLSSGSRGKKSHYREDANNSEAGRCNKQFASYIEDSDEKGEMYDKVLLSPSLYPSLHNESSSCLSDEVPRNGVGGKLRKNGQLKGSSGGRPRGKKQGRREVVDLMTLLTHCAQALASNGHTTAHELLAQIRQHSSPYGDGTQRMAHYFANALEARLAGSGRALDTSLLVKRLSAAETLQAYLAFLTASPFKKISCFFSNKSIWKLADKATRLHIIDFGIMHGFQWPRLIQHFSVRPGGPPTVCITGIDFPQPGFRPAERVEETGRRLSYYCQKFNVPFEYNAVAKKWDTIQLEDLKIQKGELLVVNCLYRLRYVGDETVETVEVNSPRDAVLKLIKRTNPDLFIHGIVNGTYSSPFFVTRFREVMLQSYSVFDMFDATLPHEDKGRMLYENEVLGRGALSVVACEGTERVIRPETYKQWQIRNKRAGLRQLPLDREIVNDVRTKVRLGYHKDFVVDEDSNWMLQGWKGRILSALSCWKPAQKRSS